MDDDIPQGSKVPLVNSTNNNRTRDVVGNKADLASNADTASLIAHTKFMEASLGVGSLYCIPVIEFSDFSYIGSNVVFSISLVNRQTGAVITSVNITAGTIDIYRVRAGIEALITNEAALVKKDGILVYVINVDGVNYAIGDTILIKVGATISKYTIGTTTYDIAIPPQVSMVTDLADIESKVDSIKTITDAIPDAGALTSLAQDSTVAKEATLTTVDNNVNSLPPSLNVRDSDTEVYPSGIAKTELFAFANIDSKIKEIDGSLYLYNFTAAKIVTISIEELDDVLYRPIDSRAYTIGTDPNPHFEFKTNKSFKVYATLNITEGIEKNIPKTISVLNYER